MTYIFDQFLSGVQLCNYHNIFFMSAFWPTPKVEFYIRRRVQQFQPWLYRTCCCNVLKLRDFHQFSYGKKKFWSLSSSRHNDFKVASNLGLVIQWVTPSVRPYCGEIVAVGLIAYWGSNDLYYTNTSWIIVRVKTEAVQATWTGKFSEEYWINCGTSLNLKQKCERNLQEWIYNRTSAHTTKLISLVQDHHYLIRQYWRNSAKFKSSFVRFWQKVQLVQTDRICTLGVLYFELILTLLCQIYYSSRQMLGAGTVGIRVQNEVQLETNHGQATEHNAEVTMQVEKQFRLYPPLMNHELWSNTLNWLSSFQ